MENLLAVVFEAHRMERNHHRRYEVSVGRDLFDDWTVTVRWGRTRNNGQGKRCTAPTADTARAVIRTHLLGRLSAPRRIGCAYRLVSCTAAEGFDPSRWLPGDVMGRLSGENESRVRPRTNAGQVVRDDETPPVRVDP